MLDAAVIGAGPIGIEVAIELQRRGLETRVFDAGAIGHTISWWAPQTRWFSSNDRIAIAGVPLHTVDQAKASREEYLNYLRGVVDQFGVSVSTFCRLVSITESAQWRLGFCRTPMRSDGVGGGDTSGQAGRPNAFDFCIDSKAVVLAIGGTDYPNRLNVPGEGLPHVDAYLREVHRYHGRRVLIVGGRNSAVEAAIRLHRGGAHVSLCYHQKELPSDGIKYWLRPEIGGLIRSGSINAFFSSRVVAITEDHVRIETNVDGQEDEGRILAFDDVLTLIGYRQDKTLFERLGILSDDASGSPRYDTQTMRTPREGIYVAGTAVGGTQSSKYQVFLENCHDHARKIADDICQRWETDDHNRGDDVSGSIEIPRRRGKSSDAGLAQRIATQPES